MSRASFWETTSASTRMVKQDEGTLAVEAFPLTSVHDSGFLDVGQGHRLYWEESGRRDGIPVVYLHGGPGAGCAPIHRRFFDPDRYRIILFDQRGCGRSTPFGSIADNTTHHLVEDVDLLRAHLGIDRWVVFGGSWGSTLALAYGQAFPERVLGFVLRGIFLGTRREIDWFLTGMGRFRPDARDAFLSLLPAAEQGDPLTHYYRRLCDPDPTVHGPAARRWAGYEDACAHVGAALAQADNGPHGNGMLSLARLEAHYMVHDCFMEEGALLRGMDKIAHLPALIVQGACDLVCPPETAWAIHQVWPQSRLAFIADAGHSALEIGIQAALIAATCHMANFMKG